MRWLIGTQNPGKQAEFRRILDRLADERGLELDVVFPSDIGIRDDVPETGGTFEANSRQKARAYFEMTGLPTFSDDGGLEIDALGGEPGVKSRRWLGYDADDEALIAHTLERLEGHDGDGRSARLRTCITFVDPVRELQECEAIRGRIAEAVGPVVTHGYPYRALFVVGGLDKFYDELSAEEHVRLNHREEALSRLVGRILG